MWLHLLKDVQCYAESVLQATKSRFVQAIVNDTPLERYISLSQDKTNVAILGLEKHSPGRAIYPLHQMFTDW